MANSTVPDDAGADATLGLADVLQDAITELLGAEATLAQLDPSPEQRDALAAVRAARRSLRTANRRRGRTRWLPP